MHFPFHQQDHALRTNDQSFHYYLIIKLRNLITTEKREHRNSYLSQITYVPGLTIICSNLIE